MKTGYSDGNWMPDNRGYAWLRPHQNKPNWYETVWCSWNIPKHSLILWLVMNNGINTREKLFRIGCCSSDNCCICEAASETQEHLFFECGYSKIIMMQITDWCGMQFPSAGENNARLNAMLTNPKRVVQLIKENVKHRIKYKRDDHMSSAEKDWILSLENDV
ncbi:uncharacterized protein LOC141640608 [Silene latifolia]|uniref:uncharacterized protein LOC141640608 n=1 Tax=Silene latifolia TaxID=37657 RepID=UPI003D76FD60